MRRYAEITKMTGSGKCIEYGSNWIDEVIPAGYKVTMDEYGAKIWQKKGSQTAYMTENEGAK